jgi:hypothetical protein
MSAARVLLGLIISIAGFIGPLGDDQATSADDVAASPDAIFRDEADVSLAQWALYRFDQAGLVLPAVLMAFHDEETSCHGHNGYFHPGSPHRIDICGFNWDRFLVTPRKVILHELAHVWVHENLDQDARQQFLDLRGLEVWQDSHAQWAEQGQEHAAEIMAWGLMDEEISMTSIGETDKSQLAEVFEFLTTAGGS